MVLDLFPFQRSQDKSAYPFKVIGSEGFVHVIFKGTIPVGVTPRRSRALMGYSAFVRKAREYEKETGSREEGVKRAIDYCRSHNILKEFLETNGSEVFNMLLTEWKLEDALVVRYEEGLERGWKKGREDGMEKGLEETARNALAEGLPLEIIRKITGLGDETINALKDGLVDAR